MKGSSTLRIEQLRYNTEAPFQPSHKHSHTRHTRNGKSSHVPGLARTNLPAMGACLCISTVQRPLWNCLDLALLTRLVPFFVPPQRPLCLPLAGPTIDHRFSRTRLLGKLPVCLLPESVLWPSSGAAFHPSFSLCLLSSKRACLCCALLSLRLSLWHKRWGTFKDASHLRTDISPNFRSYKIDDASGQLHPLLAVSFPLVLFGSQQFSASS